VTDYSYVCILVLAIETINLHSYTQVHLLVLLTVLHAKGY